MRNENDVSVAPLCLSRPSSQTIVWDIAWSMVWVGSHPPHPRTTGRGTRDQYVLLRRFRQ
ncbi:uncharacterized protein METZ01_LOCUS187998, partial [marine metagenome]